MFAVRSSIFARGRARTFPIVLAASLALPPPASAQNVSRKNIIRDAEIEQLLRDYAQPIFGAAGVSSRDSQIIIVQDRVFNAFVASGRRMVIHTGTLLDAKTPNEVIGVIAHETGHLAGGHLEKLHEQIARSMAIGAVISLLGIAGMAAGAAAGSPSGAQMGTATASLGGTVTVRTLLSYKRAQESAADRAALSYLDETHQSAKGMVTTFERFADQAILSARYADPYAQTHPMPRERLDQLETSARASPYWDVPDPPDLQLRHDMMRAKLSGFTEGTSAVGRRYPKADKSLPAQYARAIAAYRSGGMREAIRAVDALIAQAPDYPYFHELKGQFLFESGQAREAIAPLRKAASLALHPGLIRIMLGSAELGTNDDGLLDNAVADLRAGLGQEPLASIGYRQLAIAYQHQGKTAEAQLASAEGSLIDGDVDMAKTFAKRAQAQLKVGSPSWLKADDIVNYESPTASTD
jgi:predicted Zn-dependent protease